MSRDRPSPEPRPTSEAFPDRRPALGRGHQCRTSSGAGSAAASVTAPVPFCCPQLQSVGSSVPGTEAVFQGASRVGIQDVLRFCQKRYHRDGFAHL